MKYFGFRNFLNITVDDNLQDYVRLLGTVGEGVKGETHDLYSAYR